MRLGRRELKRLTEQVRQILLNEWDPIGIKDVPQAQDEYDSYVPRIVRMLWEGVDRVRLSDHLYQIETVSMGMQGSRESCAEVANELLSLVQLRG